LIIFELIHAIKDKLCLAFFYFHRTFECVCRHVFVHICGVSVHVFPYMLVPVTLCVSQERERQWGVSRPPGNWHSARSQDRGRTRDTSCACWKPLQTQETGTEHATRTPSHYKVLWSMTLHQ